jgi:hypothetical protein
MLTPDRAAALMALAFAKNCVVSLEQPGPQKECSAFLLFDGTASSS